MSRLIRISALIASIFLVAGIDFKNQHIIGANIIFILGVVAGVLSAIVMIVSFSGKLSEGLEKYNILFSSVTIVIVLLSFPHRFKRDA